MAVRFISSRSVCFRMVFLLSAEIKKAHGFVLIHALGGLYSVVREFGSLQKGKNTFFTSTKSLVKISTVETAKPPIKSGVSWAISFSLPFDGAEGETRTLAPVSRPTPLAGAPRHQLEYFCIGNKLMLLNSQNAAEKLQHFVCGAESGIRTHGTLPYDGFQDRSVITTSVSLHLIALIYYHIIFEMSTDF